MCTLESLAHSIGSACIYTTIANWNLIYIAHCYVFHFASRHLFNAHCYVLHLSSSSLYLQFAWFCIFQAVCLSNADCCVLHFASSSLVRCSLLYFQWKIFPPLFQYAETSDMCRFFEQRKKEFLGVDILVDILEILQSSWHEATMNFCECLRIRIHLSQIAFGEPRDTAYTAQLILFRKKVFWAKFRETFLVTFLAIFMVSQKLTVYGL